MGLLLRMLMQFLLVGVIISAVAPAAEPQALPGCVDMCGNVQIPYPFGINQSNRNCSRDESFSVTCENSTPTLKGNLTGNFSVTSISVEESQMEVQMPKTKRCYSESGGLLEPYSFWQNFQLTDFAVSNGSKINTFVAVGCDTHAYLRAFRNSTVTYTMGCDTRCDAIESVESGSCTGIGCCQVEIPKDLTLFNVSVWSTFNHQDVWSFNNCSYAFLVEKSKFNFSSRYLANLPYNDLPVVLDWAIRNKTCEEAKNKPDDFACSKNNSECHDVSLGYRCQCKLGYKGNPYHHDGCQEIDKCAPNLNNCTIPKSCKNTIGNYTCSCHNDPMADWWKRGDGRKDGDGCVVDVSLMIKVATGVVTCFFAVLMGCFGLYLVLQQRKLKEKFFKQNGGLTLLEKLSRQRVQTTKIFTVEELKKATDNYDKSKIIGQGGFGTVYKGSLPDEKMVAIKKSKTVDQSQIDQFINEIIVLSQINHRNVVKLLGCCLETQVPLLVYEFITKGTLFDYIHGERKPSTIPRETLWETRLRIAAKTAEALSYLYFEASTPIIHRDVKSMNILLDDKYTAKVSDFGASRLVPLDQSQIGTMVQGTIGYLDPEYFVTSQLTAKSDVYSFGVVLVELLTGKKAFSVDVPETERCLANYFLSSLKDDQLLAILENHLIDEGNTEQVQEVAQLAKRCLKMKGEERPTMEEVAMELKGLRRMNVEVQMEETEYLLGETSDAYTYGYNNNINTEQNSTRNHILLPLELDGGR